MKDRLNVLVLGVGGNVSQGILKALQLCSMPCRIIGGCIGPLSMGLYTVDKAVISPLASDPAFFDWLVRTCLAERVDAVLSGVEPVLSVLSPQAERLRSLTGAFTVVSQPQVLGIGADKLGTCRWLCEHGLNYPRYADASNQGAINELVEQCGFPLLVKPRVSKGGYGISMVRERKELDSWTSRSGYVVEEYLGDEASEYTIGCFSDRNGQVRGAIAMRRELLQGTTYRAIVGDFPEIRDEAVRIAAALRPVGPCNVQLRMASGRPTCFEINVRFSGTTALRARFGFNDVEAALRHYVLGEAAVDLPLVTEGIALRYWNEVYIDPRAKDTLHKTGILDNPRGYSSRVEDYGINR